MPSGLIEEQDGMSPWRHGLGDFGQMQGHSLGVAGGQDEAGRLAQGRTDGAEQPSGAGPLVMGCRWPCAASGPSASNLVLLADAGLVLPPDFYGFAGGFMGGDLRQTGGEVFLNASSASPSWAWWRGRAESLT